MMPQKKNPDPLELVRGKTGAPSATSPAGSSTMKGLPSGYNKDLQEDKEAVFDAEATLAASLRCRACRGVAADGQRGAVRTRGVGLAARDRRGRLPGVARHAVPAGARSRRRDGPAAAGRGARLQRADAGGMARGERDVRRRCAEGGDTRWRRFEARRTPQSTNPDAVQAALD